MMKKETMLISKQGITAPFLFDIPVDAHIAARG